MPMSSSRQKTELYNFILSFTHLIPVLGQRQAVGDVEAVGALVNGEGPRPLAPLRHFLNNVRPCGVDSDPVPEHKEN